MNTLSQVSDTRLDELIADLIAEKEARSVSAPDPKTVKIQCVGVAKTTGAQCTRTAIAGTTRCHLHPQDTGTRESKPTQQDVAENTLDAKPVRIGKRAGKALVGDLHKAMLQGACEMDYHGATAKLIRKGLTGKGWTFTWVRTNTFTATHASAAHTLTGTFGKRTRKSPSAKREFVIA